MPEHLVSPPTENPDVHIRNRTENRVHYGTPDPNILNRIQNGYAPEIDEVVQAPLDVDRSDQLPKNQEPKGINLPKPNFNVPNRRIPPPQYPRPHLLPPPPPPPQIHPQQVAPLRKNPFNPHRPVSKWPRIASNRPRPPHPPSQRPHHANEEPHPRTEGPQLPNDRSSPRVDRPRFPNDRPPGHPGSHDKPRFPPLLNPRLRRRKPPLRPKNRVVQ